MEKSKRFMYIGIIILLISLVGSIGTYAWFTWTSTDNTSVTLSIGKLADVTFTSGPDININNLAPVFNYTDGVSTTFSINNRDTSGAQLIYTVKFNVTNIDEELKTSSMKYTLLKGTSVVGEGNFSEAVTGETLILKTSSLTNGVSNYTLYFWIDSNEENNPNMMNKNLSGTIDVVVETNVITDESTSSTNFLNTEIPKEDITSVSIVSGVTPPSGVTPVDVSDAKDGSILMWYTEDGSGNKQAVISSDNIVYGGSNSNTLFSGLTNTTSLDLSNLNTSGMTSMKGMFSSLSNLEEIEFGDNFDTSEVTNMSQVFRNTTALTSLDLSNFNTSNVTDMAYMFAGSGITSLDLSNFDTSNVTNMNRMFYHTENLEVLNLSNFNTSNTIHMDAMFSCTGIESLDLSSFDTHQVQTMRQMFQHNDNLVNLDLSSFDTSNVTDMVNMFGNMNNLSSINLSNFITDKVIDARYMFGGDTKLYDIDLSNADFKSVNAYADMFGSMPHDATIKLKDTVANRLLMDHFANHFATYVN